MLGPVSSLLKLYLLPMPRPDVPLAKGGLSPMLQGAKQAWGRGARSKAKCSLVFWRWSCWVGGGPRVLEMVLVHPSREGSGTSCAKQAGEEWRHSTCLFPMSNVGQARSNPHLEGRVLHTSIPQSVLNKAKREGLRRTESEATPRSSADPDIKNRKGNTW